MSAVSSAARRLRNEARATARPRLRGVVHTSPWLKMLALLCCTVGQVRVGCGAAYVTSRPLPRHLSPGLRREHRCPSVCSKQSRDLPPPAGLAARQRPGALDRGTEDTTAVAREFCLWLREAGVDRKIAPALFGDLRGMMAQAPIAKGEALVSYPRTLTMDLASLNGCPCAELVDEAYWTSAPWYVQLGLWLISEEIKGPLSHWAPYIALLPRSISVPLSWTDTELEMLGYPPLISAVRAQRADFESILAEAKRHLKVAPSEATSLLKRLEWSMTIALSRTFQSGPPVERDAQEEEEVASAEGGGGGGGGGDDDQQRHNKALIPGLDLLNHRAGAGPKYSYDPVCDIFSLVSEVAYAPGEQV
jgi:hypothetical protein